jgi:pyruvate decarboxylase
LIHGPDRVYVSSHLSSSTLLSSQHSQNDISRWKWQELLSFFNADNIPHRSWLASTREEFEEILEDEDFARADRCQLLEVKMDRLDAPRSLILQAKLSADMNEE